MKRRRSAGWTIPEHMSSWPLEEGATPSLQGASDSAISHGISPEETSGFTLIEVLVAVVILAMGILGAATMQIAALQGNAKANKLTEASVIASDRAEVLLNMDFDSSSLADGSDTVEGYDVAWDVTAGAGGDDTRLITVTVSWTSGGVGHSFDYQILKMRDM
ncbi:type IV pilus modification PilV family protein [Desulfoluna limicola]|uniref:type IV pilus modification PilV family protein n=1 Tax=Desulfoluna limicola TaxID=2810562 RepID=UPI001F1C5530|nr:prepilin-type N-terminal cleavage/methylation domain-containing protein [Desulfoluna limicola]